MTARAAIRLVLVLSGVSAACGPAREGPTVARAWEAMGAAFTVAAWGPDSVALSRALERAADSVRVVDSLRTLGRLVIPMPDARLHADTAAEGYALDRAALALAGIADSALLNLGAPMLWVGGPTRRQVRIADPEDALRPLAAVELTGGALSTTTETERRSPRSVTVLAPSAAAADGWSSALFQIGCARALELPTLAARRVSVICADSGRVRWTPDLDGRVALPTGWKGQGGRARGGASARGP